MWKLVVFSVLLQLVYCSCPDGFDLVWSINGGECRGSVASMNLTCDTVVATATAQCNKIRGQPIIIHDNEHQDYWVGRTVSGDRPLLTLGILCNSTTNKWEWVDGSSLDFIPSLRSPELDKNCYQGVAFHFHPDGGWYLWDVHGLLPVDISCTKQLHTPINDDACEYFEDDSEDGVCYQVGETAENWKDAQIICKKLGANLASIHNLQENFFVRRLAVSRGDVTGLILGASTSGKGDDFGWIDGSDWDYDNFYPGFPRAGFGECVVMDTSTSSGQWKNMDCTAKYPVACAREKKTSSEPICSTETWKEGSVVTSPGFPYTASTPCDYYLLVDEGKNVEVEIILLEANPCCDHLILYDGYVGGIVLANLTGAQYNTTFTTTSSHIMQVSWRPNGGVNVLGFAMTFRGV